MRVLAEGTKAAGFRVVEIVEGPPVHAWLHGCACAMRATTLELARRLGREPFRAALRAVLAEPR